MPIGNEVLGAQLRTCLVASVGARLPYLYGRLDTLPLIIPPESLASIRHFIQGGKVVLWSSAERELEEWVTDLPDDAARATALAELSKAVLEIDEAPDVPDRTVLILTFIDRERALLASQRTGL